MYSLKRFATVFIITLLLLSATTPVLTASAVKAQPIAEPAGEQASPTVTWAGVQTLPAVMSGFADNDTFNVTPGKPTLQGRGKIGNLHMPPAIVSNLTQKIKNQVSDARLNLAKKIAEGKIDIIIRQLQLYEKWVANSKLSNDQKSGIKAIVDTNIAWFRQLNDDIQNAGDLDTIQALAGQADQQAGTLKVSIKNEAGIMACDELDGRIASARNASIGIADRIAALNTQGDDKARMEQKLAEYNAHVDAASGYSLAARSAFEGITSVDNTDNGFNEGYRQIGLANREMTQAYVDLKSVYLWYLQASRSK